MPFFAIVSILAAAHLWVGWRIVPALLALPQGGLAAGWAFGLLLVVSVVAMPLSFRWARHASQTWGVTAVVWFGLLCMGLFSSLFVFTLLRDVLLVVIGGTVVVADWVGAQRMSLDTLQTVTAPWVPLLALLATGWGFWHARRTAAVVTVDVPIDALHPALRGFTIAQISDIHVGRTIRRGYMQRIVERVNTLNADMVAITGDLVDGTVPELAQHVAPLADLRSRHGTFFVTGNHEYYSGAHAWISELQRLGLQVLVNRHVVLQHTVNRAGGDRLNADIVVAGVADFMAHHFIESHRSDPAVALMGAPPAAAVRLLLAHQPRSALAAAEAGFTLQLSGHTHGGQIWPWNHFVRYQQPFTAGLHRVRELWVYTNSGTGYWGPPKRFGVPSEITCLRLIEAP